MNLAEIQTTRKPEKGITMHTNPQEAATENTGAAVNMHPNLRPFRPGQSGNPGGRPKRSPITDHLKEQLERPVPASVLDELKQQERALVLELFGESPTFGQIVAFRTIQQACKPDVFALRELLDRVEGKVSQKVEARGTISLEDLVVGAREFVDRATD